MFASCFAVAMVVLNEAWHCRLLLVAPCLCNASRKLGLAAGEILGEWNCWNCYEAGGLCSHCCLSHSYLL